MKPISIAVKTRKIAGTFVAILASAMLAQTAAAQYTIKVPPVQQDTVETRYVHSFAQEFDMYKDMRTLFLNKDITTFIMNGDNIQLIDISLPGNVIAGNQPGENIARIKPIKQMADGEDMGIVTIIGERTLTQFHLVYSTNPVKATSQYKVSDLDAVNYLNPAVDMTKAQMYEYAWHIRNTDNRYYNVSSKAQRMRIRLNNIYTVGNYFFIDVSCMNYSKIRFDIEEVRIKLCDKKQSKSTNNQEIELVPLLVLDDAEFFHKEYRNVFVLPKMTFPDEKVLNITISEKQISGRTITLSIDYADVLCADSYNSALMN